MGVQDSGFPGLCQGVQDSAIPDSVNRWSHPKVPIFPNGKFF